MSQKFDKLLSELKQEFTERGIGTFLFIVQDPDSNYYGGEYADKAWSLGAMQLYKDHIRRGSSFQDDGPHEGNGPIVGGTS